MLVDHWRVFCERCKFRKYDLPTREKAIEVGDEHSQKRHPQDYRFRVQGIRVPRKQQTINVRKLAGHDRGP